MSTLSKPFASQPLAPPSVLPIEDGDHMNVVELIRRWEALPEEWREQHKHIELIHGVVRIMPPISGGYHAEPHSSLLMVATSYAWATPGVRTGSAASIILDDNAYMPEPDGFLAIDPKFGGRIRLDDKGYIHGPPELLAEISSSSVSFDLHTKKEVYEKFGVNEYVVWRVKERAVDWFVRRGEHYEPLQAIDGIYKSEVFPGLWLAATALLDGDYARVQQVLQQGLASPEHAAFVEHLKSRASS